jgi:hypothetical protein
MNRRRSSASAASCSTSSSTCSPPAHPSGLHALKKQRQCCMGPTAPCAATPMPHASELACSKEGAKPTRMLPRSFSQAGPTAARALPAAARRMDRLSSAGPPGRSVGLGIHGLPPAPDLPPPQAKLSPFVYAGPIEYATTELGVTRALGALLLSKPAVVGFDIEWRVNYTLGEHGTGKELKILRHLSPSSNCPRNRVVQVRLRIRQPSSSSAMPLQCLATRSRLLQPRLVPLRAWAEQGQPSHRGHP